MKVLEDLLDSKILKYTFLPFLMSVIFWSVVFALFFHSIYSFLTGYVSHLPFGNGISDILSALGSAIVAVVLYYFAVISTLGVFASFFIDKITLRINEKHYGCEVKEAALKENAKGVLISVFSFLIYLILFLLTFWMLFIPVVNIFYQLFMWSILNKKPLVFDSSYLFLDYKKFEKENNLKIWTIVFVTSLIYFIPFVSLFGYTFQLIILTHSALKKCKGNI